jgi:putative glutamine amidotransferase
MKPRIGIAACSSLGDYVESVRQFGGEPVVLGVDARPAGDILAELDGLVLTGGADVDPVRYGQPRHPTVEDAEPGRDAYEIAIIGEALKRDLPVLAICRGLQVLNVACGGTLVQDIPSQIASTLDHTVSTPKDAVAHRVQVMPDTLLDRALARHVGGDGSCAVNSRHHQSADAVAPGFVVSAVAPDGVIEAIERPASAFCLGVQWHPENFWRTREFQPLFEAFVAACRR